MCVSVLPACMHVHHMHLVPVKEGARLPGTGVTYGCELPCGHWELNWSPLQEQEVRLTPSHLSGLQFKGIAYALSSQRSPWGDQD